jgi:peptidyl-prolyl cis-trans isomerase D
MEAFRNLSKNIFFRIFLGFLALSFVIFGISGFIFGGNGSWIAKIGDRKVGYDKFIKAVQTDKEAIYKSNPKEDVMNYLNSDQFRSDVLSRMVTKYLLQGLQKDLGIYPSTEVILNQIAEAPDFKDKNGKFDRDLFRKFLSQNGLTEQRYIESFKDEIAGAMIVSPLVEVITVNKALAYDIYGYKEEKRYVDVITVSIKNIGSVARPNEFELNDFFEKNKSSFALPEMRNVSYIAFTKSDLLSGVVPTEKEIEDEYNNNISNYQEPETRNFYHLVFTDKKAADEFAVLFKEKAKNNNGAEANGDKVFAKLALELQKKDKKAISLNKVAKADQLKEIANDIFALKTNEISNVLESPLGFHLFYLNGVNPATNLPLAKVKKAIETNLLAKKQETVLKETLNAIDDELLSSNSLTKVAEKFKLKVQSLPKFDTYGIDSKKDKVEQVAKLENFYTNAFALKKDQASKLFYSENNDTYYALIVHEIEEGRERSLDEVKVLASDILTKSKQQQKLQELANDIAKQISESKGNIGAIVAKYNLKVEKNHEFPRFYMIDVGGGRKVPYANKSIEEIFSAKVSESTSAYHSQDDEFTIGVIRKIVTPDDNEAKVKGYANEMVGQFRSDILISYNHYIQTKMKVEINQKLLSATDKKEE